MGSIFENEYLRNTQYDFLDTKIIDTIDSWAEKRIEDYESNPPISLGRGNIRDYVAKEIRIKLGGYSADKDLMSLLNQPYSG